MDTSSYRNTVAYVPVSVAAAQLRVSCRRIYQLMEEGKIIAQRHGRTWLVSQRSIDARIALLEKEDLEHAKRW